MWENPASWELCLLSCSALSGDLTIYIVIVLNFNFTDIDLRLKIRPLAYLSNGHYMKFGGILADRMMLRQGIGDEADQSDPI